MIHITFGFEFESKLTEIYDDQKHSRGLVEFSLCHYLVNEVLAIAINDSMLATI